MSSARSLVLSAEALDDLRHWVETDARRAGRILRLIEEVCRSPFAGTGRPEPLKHLGEAECIRAIETRAELRDAIFLTDDGDAQYVAGHHGITVKDTRWLLADTYVMGDMLCPEPYRVSETR